MLTDRQLEYLLTVRDTKNLTKAANKLNISQPALSQMISGIESDLGTDIFDRKHSPLRVTYSGEIYLKTCMQMSSLHSQALKRIEEARMEETGRITIGLSLHLSIFLSHKIIPRFKARFPGFEIRITEEPVSALIDRIHSGRIDVALVYEESEPALLYKNIARENIYLVNSERSSLHHADEKNHVQPRPIELQKLHNRPFILLKKGHGMRTIADAIFRQNGITPSSIFETDSIEVARRLSEEGMGYTFIPSSALYFGNKKTDNRRYLSIKDYKSDRKIKACMQKETWKLKAVRELITLIRELLDCY